MLIDVVIPAHNAAATLGATLESVRQQTTRPASVVVVADRCVDQTAALARAWGVTTLETDDGSAAAARNLGARQGTAPWIAFVDADDQWRSTWLSSVASLARGDVRYGRIDELEGEVIRRPHNTPAPAGNVIDSLLTRPFVATSAVVVRRAWFERVGGFDAAFRGAGVEDLDLWLRLAAGGASFTPVPGRHVIYRRGGGSAVRNPEAFDRMLADSLWVVGRHLHLTDSATLRTHALSACYRMSAQRRLNFGAPGALPELIEALRLTPTDRRLWGYAVAGFVPWPARRAIFRLRRGLRKVV